MSNHPDESDAALKPSALPRWQQLPFFCLTIAALSLAFAALFHYEMLIYLVIFIAVIFSGYFVFGIFNNAGHRFYISLALVSSVLIGGILGLNWDRLLGTLVQFQSASG